MTGGSDRVSTVISAVAGADLPVDEATVTVTVELSPYELESLLITPFSASKITPAGSEPSMLQTGDMLL